MFYSASVSLMQTLERPQDWDQVTRSRRLEARRASRSEKAPKSEVARPRSLRLWAAKPAAATGAR